MKLYAKVNNSVGKVVSIGDNEMVRIELKRGNQYSFYIYYTPETLLVEKSGKKVFLHQEEQKGKKQKDEINPVQVAECEHIFKNGVCTKCDWTEVL